MRKFKDALKWLQEDEERSLYYLDWDNSSAILFVKEVIEAGGKVEVCVDPSDCDYAEGDYSSAIFITAKPPISKQLFAICVELKPDEFDKYPRNRYRFWLD